MIFRFIIFLGFWCVAATVHAQKNDLEKVINSEILRLVKITNDSIKSISKKHKRIREEMIKLVETNFLDKELVFGKNDRYLKLGLHRNFIKPPVTLKAFYNRNPDIIKLEENHVALYEEDIQLFLWKGMESTLVNKAKIKTQIGNKGELTRKDIKEEIVLYCISNIRTTQAKLHLYLDDFKAVLLQL